MAWRGRKTSHRRHGSGRDRRTGLPLIRRISGFALERPPRDVPGVIVAALPFVLLVGLAWNVPGFWQVPAVVAGGVVVGLLILRMDWSAGAKTAVTFAAVALSALAFAASGTAVAPFVLPLIAVSLVLSFLRARAVERDARERDAWRRR